MKYRSPEEIPLELAMRLQEDELIKIVEEPESDSDVGIDSDENRKRKSRGDLPTRPGAKRKRGGRKLATALIRDPVKYA